MQNLFAFQTPWHTPWMARVLPVVTRIAERYPSRTVFTRFIPPQRPDQMPGSWRRYYERWRDLTLDRIDPQLVKLIPSLAALQVHDDRNHLLGALHLKDQIELPRSLQNTQDLQGDQRT